MQGLTGTVRSLHGSLVQADHTPSPTSPSTSSALPSSSSADFPDSIKRDNGKGRAMSSSINVSSEDSLNLATFRGRRYPSPSSESELTSSVDEEDSNSMVQGEENASKTLPRLGGNSTGTNSNMYLTYFVFGDIIFH